MCDVNPRKIDEAMDIVEPTSDGSAELPAPPTEAQLTAMKVSEFVDDVTVAITNARIYGRGHPRFDDSIAGLVRGMKQLTTSTGGDVEIGVYDGYLFYDRRPLIGVTLSANRIIEPLSRLSSSGIAFKGTATEQDFLTLVEFLGHP